MAAQQGFQFGVHLRISAASVFQKFLALRRGTFQGGVKQIFEETPSFRRQCVPPNSRSSHASAKRKSRFTEASDISTTSAISSAVKPAKKRNSMTRAFRGSKAASASRASSRATNSAARSFE